MRKGEGGRDYLGRKRFRKLAQEGSRRGRRVKEGGRRNGEGAKSIRTNRKHSPPSTKERGEEDKHRKTD